VKNECQGRYDTGLGSHLGPTD